MSLVLANAARQAFEHLGSPEGELALAQLTVHLACAPKSNAVYTAFSRARKAARETGSLPPPAHILNAPTRLMKSPGYGEAVSYPHLIPPTNRAVALTVSYRLFTPKNTMHGGSSR